MKSFNERIQETTRGGWIRAAIWSLLYILFIIWVGNFWWLFLLPLIVDAFVTQYIPWSWWRKYKDTNKTLYTICSWVDAIVFALVAVYFINLYFFQNYQIPSSSLEKTLLVGDYLYVSKAAYGPRVPNTPLSFPLMQHTAPAWLGGWQSYLEKPQWEYKRLAGRDEIEREDIVVFNFPAGDTVCTKVPNPDYYTLCYYYGREAVHTNKELGEIVWRPVDRRENYVKRCVALPGDTFQIINNQIYVNGEILPDHEGVQYNYYVQTTGGRLSEKYMEKLGISKDDRLYVSPTTLAGRQQLDALGLDINLPTYHFPLTKAMKAQLEKNANIARVMIEPDFMGGVVYPLGHNDWTRDNYGPVYMPRRGEVVPINTDNYWVYERVIRAYEGQEIAMRDSVVYINGEATDSYTFQMDYYWMMGDNRHKSADSRYWGFVPEDHIVGRPVFIWMSIDKDKKGFSKIRWSRIGKSAKQ